MFLISLKTNYVPKGGIRWCPLAVLALMTDSTHFPRLLKIESE